MTDEHLILAAQRAVETQLGQSLVRDEERAGLADPEEARASALARCIAAAKRANRIGRFLADDATPEPEAVALLAVDSLLRDVDGLRPADEVGRLGDDFWEGGRL